uniref:Uncharacterized protein n=1 Tax=Arundo donax TaxID=35708 RepID=A0A0A9E8D1_ARUDO
MITSTPTRTSTQNVVKIPSCIVGLLFNKMYTSSPSV